jgi:hypothetical protein
MGHVTQVKMEYALLMELLFVELVEAEVVVRLLPVIHIALVGCVMERLKLIVK